MHYFAVRQLATDALAPAEPVEVIDEAWLLSVGFESDDEAQMHYIYGPKHLPFYQSWADGLWYFGMLPIQQPRTKQDVLACLAALGITKKETPHD